MIQELRPQGWRRFPGIRVFLQNPPRSASAASSPRACTSSRCRAPTPTSSTAIAPQLEAKLRELPGLQDVTSDLQIKNPQVDVEIDRDRAAALGVTRAADRGRALHAYGTRQVSTIYAPNNQYRVILELLPEYQRDPSALSAALRPLAPAAASCRSTRWPA